MPNPFSLHLSAIIEEDGRSLARLAREAVPPLPYSTVYGWASGSRLPVNGEQLATLAEVLRLNRGEAAALRRKFQIAIHARAAARVDRVRP